MIIILDFGSQYSQLIARRVRELNVYCEIMAWNSPVSDIKHKQPTGIILSGGPRSIYEKNAPKLSSEIVNLGLPILGICYGMHALTKALNGSVIASDKREYGNSTLILHLYNPLITCDSQQVWMSHGDRVDIIPEGFEVFASTSTCPVAVMGNLNKRLFGIQFHPEVNHTPKGKEIIRNFIINICQSQPDWTPTSIIDKAIENIRSQVGTEKVIIGLSGGIDSAVATLLTQKAIGRNMTALFINNGLMRKGEVEEVKNIFKPLLGDSFHYVDSSQTFLNNLKGIIDPEEKRRTIGSTFIRVFEGSAKKLGKIPFLVQGTIYPDVVESTAKDASFAQKIKTHHNVGGLPTNIEFDLVEPLRFLFKDEVRHIAKELGLPDEIIWRQPFPGPGLAVRCLGEVTHKRLSILKDADKIFTDELSKAGLLRVMIGKEDELKGSSQAFAVLLPVKSVGVMGDQRVYQEIIALRAVTSEDFMTADWAKLPFEFLAAVSNRIVNEVTGVSRVVYDITSKPPATIEWE